MCQDDYDYVRVYNLTIEKNHNITCEHKSHES